MRWLADIGSKAEGASLRERERGGGEERNRSVRERDRDRDKGWIGDGVAACGSRTDHVQI